MSTASDQPATADDEADAAAVEADQGAVEADQDKAETGQDNVGQNDPAQDAPMAPSNALLERAQQAFERGDFHATRTLLVELEADESAASLSPEEHAIVTQLKHAVVPDRFTLSVGIAAILAISAILVYYVFT